MRIAYGGNERIKTKNEKEDAERERKMVEMGSEGVKVKIEARKRTKIVVKTGKTRKENAESKTKQVESVIKGER